MTGDGKDQYGTEEEVRREGRSLRNKKTWERMAHDSWMVDQEE